MDRRDSDRLPLQMVVREVTRETEHQGMTLNVSNEGLYLNRLATAEQGVARGPDSPIALEIELPGTSDTIWATAEVCHNRQQAHFHGTGMRFLTMADKHRRLLRRFLSDYRAKLRN